MVVAYKKNDFRYPFIPGSSDIKKQYRWSPPAANSWQATPEPRHCHPPLHSLTKNRTIQQIQIRKHYSTMMDGFGVRWAEPPSELWSRTPALNSSPEGFGFQANSSSAFINQLRFAASKSVRTSFVILASFNALAGATTAFGIYWDCYMSARRKNPDFSLKYVYLTWGHLGSLNMPDERVWKMLTAREIGLRFGG